MTEISDPMAVEFLHYNRWANLALIEACIGLTPEQLASTIPGVYGTVYATFGHILRSEAHYLHRLTGAALDPPFSWDKSPSLSQMHAYAGQVGAALIAAAEALRMSDTFPRTWDEPEWQGQPERYKKVSLLIQVLNHGIEHRTNITTILAQQGIEPPGLDGWEYMLMNPDRVGA